MQVKAMLLKMLIPTVVDVLEGILTEDTLRHYADELFDWLKKVIKASDTPWDDRVALPIVQALERAFGDPTD